MPPKRRIATRNLTARTPTTVYYAHLSHLENWARQYVGASLKAKARSIADRGNIEDIEGVLTTDARSRLMLDDPDGDRYKFPKVGWEYAEVVLTAAGRSIQYQGVVTLDGDFAENIGTEVLENQRVATDQRDEIMRVLLEVLDSVKRGSPGDVSDGARWSAPSALDWRNVNTWGETLSLPSGEQTLSTIVARELGIMPSSPPHVRKSLTMIGKWITMVRVLDLDYVGTPVAELGNEIMSHLREAAFAREGVDMAQFHRLRAEDDPDPLTVAAAKAGLKAAKKRLQPGRCFTCGLPGHKSPQCPGEKATTKEKGGATGANRL